MTEEELVAQARIAALSERRKIRDRARRGNERHRNALAKLAELYGDLLDAPKAG